MLVLKASYTAVRQKGSFQNEETLRKFQFPAEQNRSLVPTVMCFEKFKHHLLSRTLTPIHALLSLKYCAPVLKS